MKAVFFRNAAFFLLAFLFFNFNVLAQDKTSEPELSVAGIKLGDRASAKKFLGNYSAATGDEGEPQYSFWNKFGNQVMQLHALSFDDPYFITKIEVFYAPESYRGRHYVLNDQGYFVTENGIFIGYRQSVASMIVGVPNVGRSNRIGANDIVKKIGEPTSRTKEVKKEFLTYDLGKIDIDIEGKKENVNYLAKYETSKNKLRRFSIEISSENFKR